MCVCLCVFFSREEESTHSSLQTGVHEPSTMFTQLCSPHPASFTKMSERVWHCGFSCARAFSNVVCAVNNVAFLTALYEERTLWCLFVWAEAFRLLSTQNKLITDVLRRTDGSPLTLSHPKSNSSVLLLPSSITPLLPSLPRPRTLLLPRLRYTAETYVYRWRI